MDPGSQQRDPGLPVEVEIAPAYFAASWRNT